MTQTSAIIVWTTDTDGPSEVHYGTPVSIAPASSDLFVEPLIPGFPQRSYYVHVAHLSGLQPGTTYSYSVLTGAVDLTAADSLSLHTDGGPGHYPLHLLAFGDSGVGTQTQRDLATRMAERQFDLVLHTGDVVYPYGTYDELDSEFFDVYKGTSSRVPFYLAIGNHDYYTLDGQPYIDDFYLPEDASPPAANERYYSFDYGPVHFVALDTEIIEDYPGPATSQQMLDWLDQDLAATTQPWKIVFLHKTPYTSSNITVEPGVDRFLPIIERHHVDLVLNGHHHLYTRTLPLKGGVATPFGDGGIPHVNTGGGGGGFHLCQPRWYTAVCLRQYHFLDLSIHDNCLLTYDAIGVTNNVLDQFRLNRCQPDSDGDGCTDSQELGPNQGQGGQRDPFNPWDYFNPTGDGINRSDDITAVVVKYGHDQGVSGDYDVKYDRTALPGGHPWQFEPPDGTIRTADIMAAVNSYGHDCS